MPRCARPGLRLFEAVVARPLELPGEGRTIVVRPRVRPERIARGDLVAYNVAGFRLPGPGVVPVVVRDGILMGRVIGLPGDRITFRPDQVLVNGRPGPAQPLMPPEGGLVVQPGTWFIWPGPELRVRLNGNVSAESLAQAYRRLSEARQTEFVGRPYGRWFFDRQSLP